LSSFAPVTETTMRFAVHPVTSVLFRVGEQLLFGKRSVVDQGVLLNLRYLNREATLGPNNHPPEWDL